VYKLALKVLHVLKLSDMFRTHHLKLTLEVVTVSPYC